MKKSILLLSTLALFATATNAQSKATPTSTATGTSTAQQTAPTADQNPDAHMKFTTEEHNFNTSASLYST